VHPLPEAVVVVEEGAVGREAGGDDGAVGLDVRPDEFLGREVVVVVMRAVNDLLLALVEVVDAQRGGDTTAEE